VAPELMPMTGGPRPDTSFRTSSSVGSARAGVRKPGRNLMRPEDVPVQFSRATIEIAMTAWMMGSMNFESDHAQALGQMFAILVGHGIRADTAAVTRFASSRMKDSQT
jgi:hypothetical protein